MNAGLYALLRMAFMDMPLTDNWSASFAKQLSIIVIQSLHFKTANFGFDC
jgi:hypothetical protein